MKNAIEINVGGIKCDNQSCDYMDKSVKYEDYADWVNKPCPKCGSNLLTQADLDSLNQLLGLANAINSKIGPVQDDLQPVTKADLKMDGSGKIHIDMAL